DGAGKSFVPDTFGPPDHRDRGSVGRQRQGDRAAQPATGTGDDRGAAIESSAHRPDPTSRVTPCTRIAVVWSTQLSSSGSSGRSSMRNNVDPPISSINRSGSTSR